MINNYAGQVTEVRAMRLTAVRSKLVMSVVLVVAIISISTSVFAHHGNTAYDEKTMTVKGTVTAWEWTNPHSFLKFDAKDDAGNVTHWLGEWNAPSTLVNFGITRKSFKVGDEVTVTMRGMAKNGQPVGRVSKVVLPDGQELSMGNER